MSMEMVLSIVGAFLVVVGAVNAFFLRGIFQDLNSVKITMVQIATRGEAKEKRLDAHDENFKEIFDRLNIIEREVLK